MRKYTKLAVGLMKKHGLDKKGWKFGYDNAKTRCGVCDYSSKSIKLSRHYVRDAGVDAADVMNTILHEIAHALAGYEAAHDATWKRVATAIGCNGDTCNSVWKGAAANYRLWCKCRRVDVLRYRLSAKFKKCVCATCKTLNIDKM